MRNYGLRLRKSPPAGSQLFGSSEADISVDDWLLWYSDGELQYGVYFDSMSCVSFALNNDIEPIFNYKIANKLFFEDNIKWLKDNGYFNEKGQTVLS